MFAKQTAMSWAGGFLEQYPHTPRSMLMSFVSSGRCLRKTIIRCVAHVNTPSTALNEGCGAQAHGPMELSEMAVFLANPGLGWESFRAHVMGQARVMLIVLWKAACADGLRRTGVAKANGLFGAEHFLHRNMSRPVASCPSMVSSEPSDQ